MKLLSILFFVILSSCNKTTPISEPDKAKVQADGKTDTAQYPHGKDFFKEHGAKFLGNREQCLGCHAKDGSGGTAKVSCTQCHEVYPHVNFLSATDDQHKVAYQKSPQSCAKCHGDDWGGGKSGVSCFKCHENFPHPKKWASPDQHGKFFAGLKEREKCLSCHDVKKPEAQSTQCATCHKSYPHDENFKGGNKTHRLLGQSYEGKCLSCHRDYKENMPSFQKPEDGLGCMYCHSGKIDIHWKEEAQQAPGNNGKLIQEKNRLPSSTHKKIKK